MNSTMRSTTQIVLLVSLLLVGSLAAPNAWSPRLKTFDIWGDDSEPPITDRSSLANNDDGPELIAGNDARGQYTDSGHNQTGSRDARVLNFFPLPVDDECLADDGARSGICLNTYECRIQGGTSRGQCALGFGVCCIFTATCDQEVFNNITYIVSPSFPSLMTRDIKNCTLKIKMISAEVSQLRLDFVHFSMGQPNRSTGVCDGDQFVLSGGAGGEFMLCGQNNGQHIYYDVPAPIVKNDSAVASRADPGEDGVIDLIMNFSERFGASRLFEIRVTQIPFSQRAPAGCLQYFTSLQGIIQTFNYAENGRHLSNQKYRSCVRQETGMCSIQYEPCHDQAFRIGPHRRRGDQLLQALQGPGSVLNPQMSIAGLQQVPAFPAADLQAVQPIQSLVTAADPAAASAAAAAPADLEAAASDTVEGSGGGDLPSVPSGVSPASAQSPPSPAATSPVTQNTPLVTISVPTAAPASSFFSLPTSITSFFNRAFFGTPTPTRQIRRTSRSANEPPPFHTRERQSRQSQFFGSECTDRITLPCVVEDFIAAGMGNVPTCLPIHCGSTLCAAGVFPCRIESTVKPFGIGVHFGEVGADEEKGSPEENIGACLRFAQVTC